MVLSIHFALLCNFFGHGSQFPFRMVRRGFILPEFCKPYLFLPFLPFAKRSLHDPNVYIYSQNERSIMEKMQAMWYNFVYI